MQSTQAEEEWDSPWAEVLGLLEAAWVAELHPPAAVTVAQPLQLWGLSWQLFRNRPRAWRPAARCCCPCD